MSSYLRTSVRVCRRHRLQRRHRQVSPTLIPPRLSLAVQMASGDSSSTETLTSMTPPSGVDGRSPCRRGNGLGERSRFLGRCPRRAREGPAWTVMDLGNQARAAASHFIRAAFSRWTPHPDPHPGRPRRTLRDSTACTTPWEMGQMGQWGLTHPDRMAGPNSARFNFCLVIGADSVGSLDMEAGPVVKMVWRTGSRNGIR
jgi:hypothetical protein